MKGEHEDKASEKAGSYLLNLSGCHDALMRTGRLLLPYLSPRCLSSCLQASVKS